MRKFSESLDSKIDAEYIKQCFADLSDSGVAEISERSGNYVAVTISLPGSQTNTSGMINEIPEEISSDTSIGKVVEIHDRDNEVYQDIKIALQRLSDEYPNYRIKAENFLKLNLFIYPSLTEWRKNSK